MITLQLFGKVVSETWLSVTENESSRNSSSSSVTGSSSSITGSIGGQLAIVLLTGKTALSFTVFNKKHFLCGIVAVFFIK